MFNVCTKCGEYSDENEVLSSPARSKCRLCGFEYPFLRLPAFFVTGASGTGKTTIALAMLKTDNPFVCLDQDILWNDSFNSGSASHDVFRNTWLRLIKNINQSGKAVMLFGSTIPEQIENCPERRYIGDTYYLALVCQPGVLANRLTARPQWRNSGTKENVQKMIEFNDWLSNNAQNTNPNMRLLDTTAISLAESVCTVKDWFMSPS